MRLKSQFFPLSRKSFRLGGIFLATCLGGLALVDNWLPYALVSYHNRSVEAQRRPAEERLTIIAVDGTVTKGWLIPPPAERWERLPQATSAELAVVLPPPALTIIVLHGLGANRQDYLDWALELQSQAAARGIPLRLAMMDLRSHGESEGKYFTFGSHEAQDVVALINTLEAHHVPVAAASRHHYGAVGISAGGAVAIAAAAQDARISALMTIGTFADLAETARSQTPILPPVWQNRIFRRAEAIAQFDIAEAAPVRNLARVTVPTFIAHGREDSYIPFTNAERLYQAANGLKQLYPITAADHADMVATGGTALQTAMLQFLEAAITTPDTVEIAP